MGLKRKLDPGGAIRCEEILSFVNAPQFNENSDVIRRFGKGTPINKMYVREAYSKLLVDIDKGFEQERHTEVFCKVLVLGRKGSGKSVFVPYLLHHLAKGDHGFEVIILDVEDFRFREKCLVLTVTNDVTGIRRRWSGKYEDIDDVRYEGGTVLQIFDPSHDGKSITNREYHQIIVSSPDHNHFKDSYDLCDMKFVMPPYELHELLILNGSAAQADEYNELMLDNIATLQVDNDAKFTKVSYPPEEIVQRFEVVGGDARQVFGTKALDDLKYDVTQVIGSANNVKDLLNKVNNMATISHLVDIYLLATVPAKDNFGLETSVRVFASPYIEEEMMNTLAQQEREWFQVMYCEDTGIAATAPLRGTFFERLVFTAMTQRHVTLPYWTLDDSGKVKNGGIIVPPEMLEYNRFTLAEVDEATVNTGQLSFADNVVSKPKSKIHKTFDGYGANKGMRMGKQMTISTSHPMIRAGLAAFVKNNNRPELSRTIAFFVPKVIADGDQFKKQKVKTVNGENAANQFNDIPQILVCVDIHKIFSSNA